MNVGFLPFALVGVIIHIIQKTMSADNQTIDNINRSKAKNF